MRVESADVLLDFATGGATEASLTDGYFHQGQFYDNVSSSNELRHQMSQNLSSTAPYLLQLLHDINNGVFGNASDLAHELEYEDVFDDVFADFKASLYTYKQPKNIVLMTIYAVVFLLSLLGNILVILVIVSNRSMRSVTNYFLLNLAVADLLVTFVCIPFTMGEMVYKAWIYGLALCKATGYLQGVSIAASVLTIMGLALDRYLALSHPVKARRLSTPEHARIVLILIWVIAGSIMIPLVFVRHLAIHPLDPAQSLAFCHERWPGVADRAAYDLFLFVFIYVVPGGVVLTSYAATGCHLLSTDSALMLQQPQSVRRQNSVESSQAVRILAGRRRVARMLLALAGLFACSWLPYHIVSLHLDFQDDSTDTQSLAALSFALLLGHSHSAQNPILYCIMHSSLKKGMMRLLICRTTSDTRCDLHSSIAYTKGHQLSRSFRLSTKRGASPVTSNGTKSKTLRPLVSSPCTTPQKATSRCEPAGLKPYTEQQCNQNNSPPSNRDRKRRPDDDDTSSLTFRLSSTGDHLVADIESEAPVSGHVPLPLSAVYEDDEGGGKFRAVVLVPATDLNHKLAPQGLRV